VRSVPKDFKWIRHRLAYASDTKPHGAGPDKQPMTPHLLLKILQMGNSPKGKISQGRSRKVWIH
jgi:hypothetical protein